MGYNIETEYDVLFVSDGKEEKALPIAEIKLVRSFGNYCRILTFDEIFTERITIDNAEELLKVDRRLIRIHRLFIIRASWKDCIKGLKDEERSPHVTLGDRLKESLQKLDTDFKTAETLPSNTDGIRALKRFQPPLISQLSLFD